MSSLCFYHLIMKRSNTYYIMFQKLASFIYFKILKWEMEGDFPEVDKCVVAVVPHTHWIDLFLGILLRNVWGKSIGFIGKQSLFNIPIVGWILKKAGGMPVVRHQKQDTVSAIASIFNRKNVFRLSLSPEGTRKKVTEWKTGFYFIAKQAKVPLVLVAFDYGHKKVKISKVLIPTDDKEADFKQYETFFKGVVGRVAKNS